MISCPIPQFEKNVPSPTHPVGIPPNGRMEHHGASTFHLVVSTSYFFPESVLPCGNAVLGRSRQLTMTPFSPPSPVASSMSPEYDPAPGHPRLFALELLFHLRLPHPAPLPRPRPCVLGFPRPPTLLPRKRDPSVAPRPSLLVWPPSSPLALSSLSPPSSRLNLPGRSSALHGDDHF